MLEKDRERYLYSHAWMFKPYLQTQAKNNFLQIESDNKLRNMVEGGTSSGALQFVPSDPVSKFMFNSVEMVDHCNQAPISYSEPYSYFQKQIIKENTRLPEFMRPQPKEISAADSLEARLGKREIYDFNTPNLLGIYQEKGPEEKSPFNLKRLLGEDSDSDEEQEEEGQDYKGFKPLRFPSPSPSIEFLPRPNGQSSDYLGRSVLPPDETRARFPARSCNID